MSVKSTSGTGFGAPGKGAIRRSDGGRRCDEPGCATILSAYNSSTTCYLHTQPTPRHPLAAR